MTYSVVVTRAATANANLSHLTISSGTLAPAFASGTTSYTASVANTITVVTLTPTLADPTAIVTVNGHATVSGTASVNIPLSIGANNIAVVVTAQDGITTKTYTVVVTKLSGGTPPTLRSLAISAGTLTPLFAASTNDYSARVGRTISSIRVTPVSREISFTITVNGTTVKSGTASPDLPLLPGSNTILIQLTAKDGVTTNTYAIIVTREGMPSNGSSVALASLEYQPDSFQNEDVAVHQSISPNGDGI